MSTKYFSWLQNGAGAGSQQPDGRGQYRAAANYDMDEDGDLGGGSGIGRGSSSGFGGVSSMFASVPGFSSAQSLYEDAMIDSGTWL